MFPLKQSTATTIRVGPFVDAGDGVTFEDALTIQKADVRLSKNGGDFAAASQDQGASDAGAVYDESGHYIIELDTDDTDTLGPLRIFIAKSGALPVWLDCIVLPENAFDAAVGGTGTLEVTTVAFADSASDAVSGIADLIGEPDTDLASDIEAIGDRLPAALTAGGNIKADVIAVSGDTGAADSLKALYSTNRPFVQLAVVSATNAKTFVVSTPNDIPSDSYKNMWATLTRLSVSNATPERQRIAEYARIDGTSGAITLASGYTSPPAADDIITIQ